MKAERMSLLRHAVVVSGVAYIMFTAATCPEAK